MSRLIVKNLPAYLSDVRLKEHFGQRGLVTDVKLMTRPDGTSRRFGFVGYRTEEEARDAMQYFHRTFIDASRIQVDVAKKIGDEGLAGQKETRMRRSHHGKEEMHQVTNVADSKGPSPVPDKKSKKDKAAEKSKASKGVSFEEFMAVMAPKKKRKTWQNEEDDPEMKLKESGTSAAAAAAEDHNSDQASQRKKSKRDGSGDDAIANSSTVPGRDDREITPDAALNDEELTDMDYLARRMKRNVTATEPEKTFEQSDSEGEEEDGKDDDRESEPDVEDDVSKVRIERQRLAAEEKARKDQEAVDTIMASGRLFIRNLPFAATEEDLMSHFSSYGPLKQAHIPLDKSKKTSKGLAFVSFETPAHALAAYRAADGSTFQGRLLHLLPAVDLRPRPEGPKSVKQSKSDERKAKADKDFNWSMLYMSGDAVASSISQRLGVDKADILNPSDDGGDSAAVRLALAETRVIQETKEFLEREGVNVSAFEDGKAAKKTRSDTTILVKNIPYGTTPETIREMFEAHGEVDRVLIPPTGTLALVEMAIPGEARVAFRALAYRRLGNSIIYLEKAPVGLIEPSARAKRAVADVAAARRPIVAPPSKKQSLIGSGSGSEAEVEPGATLFVKNLNFSTTDEGLAKFFGALSDFAFARVQNKVDTREPSKRLSMGYGFVGYRSIPAAQAALNTLNGKELDGHSLSLSFARRGQDADDLASSSSKAASTKLVVKNLPFEATKKDVRTLFSSYGQLKSVRVPRKAASVAGAAGGGARGFAFVEFTTKKEALGAFEALRHTHLLGRHLVLAWDKEDGKDVEGMREKVRETFHSAREAGDRRRKEKLKLREEDIAEAARMEREKKGGNNDDDDDDE